MDDFEPYDCFHQMTGETCSSQLGSSVGHWTDHDYYCLLVPPQQKANKYVPTLQEDDDDVFLDRLLQSPLSTTRDETTQSRRNDEKQEETTMMMQVQNVSLVSNKTSSELHHSIEVNARNITPTFKPQQQDERKKRKNHFLNPGTHLARTLNFPYKSDASNTDGGDFSKRLKIWNDEADQGRVLEKHFNPEWQFQFMNEFYGRSDAPSLSSRNNMKSRAINNNYDQSEGDLNYIVRHQKIDECNKKQTKKDNEEGYHYGTKPKSLDANILKKASLKLLAAMDLSDISRNNVFRIEEEINFDRKKYLL
ncbi:predicted protein [Chaetoceros tenuissimus]|uniref:Uncharacterized protein n=1 Tax=Chaetoceros tenuissimus TaxID=426638 RepID=A0AAD3DC52_9STRA|nr:predicted protein [Chaetoceros tenuissimus]